MHAVEAIFKNRKDILVEMVKCVPQRSNSYRLLLRRTLVLPVILLINYKPQKRKPPEESRGFKV
jgi:hypothetical protein